MWYDRQHWGSTLAGHFTGGRPGVGRILNYIIWINFCRLLYMPTIGLMFLVVFLTPNPLNLSLFMEGFNLYRAMEGADNYILFTVVYPAFVAQYMAIGSIPCFLGLCEALKELGQFLAISRWPTQLFCGDPMACWR